MKDLFVCYKDSDGNFHFWPILKQECFLIQDIPGDVCLIVAIMTKSHLKQIADALCIEVLDN